LFDFGFLELYSMGCTTLTGVLPEAALRSTLRTNILGVNVSVINMSDAIRRSDELIRSDGKGYICATDVHSVTETLSDPELRKILNKSFLTTPDGMPLVWIGRLQGHKRMRRVYGPDFLIEMCRLSVDQRYRHFFYGGKPGIAERLSARLKSLFPGLNIVGTYTPPFRSLTTGEERRLFRLVERAKPDVIWVGLGSPKQERFMAHYYEKLECRLMVGVGAAFDFHSGAVKEAPRWLQYAGLQWLHRLMQEPQRLGRRYLTCIPIFLWKVGLQFVGWSGLRHEAGSN
jgi:N-acetylglucosaminyldiphosphoundecaprenol N-acetyl-beta-D-mannosaminyltransferase